MHKIALVTGGTRGVGKEIAKMFQRRNIDVIITGRTKDSAKAAAHDLNLNGPCMSHGGNVTGYELDFTTQKSNEEGNQLLNLLETQQIKPTYLINNAGVLMLEPMKQITPKQLNVMFNVNIYGPMLLTKYCMPHILKNKYGGILFNCPPYTIDDKTTYLMPYMQTKLAQTTFMRSLANSIPSDSDVHVSSFWTNYPLMTDAILKRGIGNEADCMHPRILARTVEEILFGKPLDPSKSRVHNGTQIVDKPFLESRNIDLSEFQMDKEHQPPHLDELFALHLNKKT
jgi:short-subunit dehydrogenase